ncbi:MAG: type II toxin-antitoxin system HicA family toxin [Elusimicrobia bacterium]|nr:type II toxin-antitoxin system HicA family toxin [Elusimicrobiota bacterium]
MATAREVVHFLKRKGFVEKRQSGSHLVLQHPKTRLRTVVPIHPGDLPTGLFHRILKDAGFDLADFLSK